MLNVDKFFYKAIKQNSDVVALVSGRIYNPARTIEQEDEDIVPYIIIAYDGGSSDNGTKDSILQTLNGCTCSILCCAESRDALATLTEKVQTAIGEAFEDDDFYDDSWVFYITDCSESVGPVQYDPMKPCCYQTFTFQCSTDIR